ncbi:hypothetical protein [Actinoplanes sp. NPDC049316]|uniref:hypothetical protein n=1 Tax=Actinoplanes sp. NPDC049316 TaxID=3154727 RepID=UPI0034202895
MRPQVTRRIIATAATLTLAALAAATPVTPVQAGGKYGPRLLVKIAVPMVKAATPAWVKTWWTTRSDICDVRVTVTGGPDIAAVTYPSNTGTYTSFFRSADLARGQVDYTAMKLTTTADAAGWITLDLAVAYTKLPGARQHAAYSACTGKRAERTTHAQLYVRPRR